MRIPESILHCDLSILSYHLYHQSVVWPLDPWYDVMTRKLSDRRTLFMAGVHDWCDAVDPGDGFRGPSSATFGGNSNRELDPVVTRYDQLNPRLPAFTGTADGYVTIQTPKYLTDRIRTLEVARYNDSPNLNGHPQGNRVEIFEVCDYPNGSDHVIGFEGGHGLSALTTEPAWSLMGYVMMRKDPADPSVHDIHIAFRGSRSGGSVARTILQALGKHGNPDWVTDLANFKTDNDWISREGRVGRGFSYALQTCFGTLYEAIKRLHTIYGPPRQVTLTGHSLGAALSCQMALAMANGRFGAYLARAFPAWPWDSIRYVGFAQPTCGSSEFSANWDRSLSGCFYWVKGDIIVTGGEGSSKGVGMASQHGGESVRFPKVSGADENPHELFLARAGALIEMASRGQFLDARLSGITPWAQYDSFLDMIEGNAKSYKYRLASPPDHITQKNIRSVLNGYKITRAFDDLFSILKLIVLDPKAYKKPKIFQRASTRQTKSERAERAARRLRKVGWEGGDRSMEELKTDVLDTLVAEIVMAKDIQGENTARYLGLGLAVNAFARSNLSWTDLKSRPEILACLKS